MKIIFKKAKNTKGGKVFEQDFTAGAALVQRHGQV